MSKGPKSYHWPCRHGSQGISPKEKEAMTAAHRGYAAIAAYGHTRDIDGLAIYEVDDMILAATGVWEIEPLIWAVKIKAVEATVLEVHWAPNYSWVRTFVPGPWQARLLALDIVDPATEVKGGNSHE